MKFFNNKKGKKWLFYLIFGGFAIKLLKIFFNKEKIIGIFSNLKNFFKQEEKEVEELATGKENFEKYIKDTCSIFKKYFVPSECNEYKPIILRTKSLTTIALLLVIFKIFLTFYLFLVYPNLARMSMLIQEEVFNLINYERERGDIVVVSLNDELSNVAREKAEDMINSNYFSHRSPDGKMVWDLIDRNKYAYLYVGENLGMNFTTAQSVHKALMSSLSHKKNILNGKYDEVGIAVINGMMDNKETNVLVQVFASRKKPVIAAAKAAEPAVPINKTSVENNLTNNGINASADVLSVEKKVEEKKETEAKPIAKETAGKSESGNKIISSDDSDKIVASNTEAMPGNIEGQPAGENGAAELAEDLDKHIIASAREVAIKGYQRFGTVSAALYYSKYVFMVSLVLMTILLMVNIFVKISIQHKPVIVQTVLLIIFIAGLMTIKFHFVENIAEKIIIA